MTDDPRPLPLRIPEADFFWDGAARGELLLQRCRRCDKVYFPPRPFCPDCASRDVGIFKASGKATLYSYIINHLPAPGYTPPFSIAVVTLEEGPRMMCNIVECPQTPEALILDMPLVVTFEARGDVTVPQFRPAAAE